jgi:hypothetical protein
MRDSRSAALPTALNEQLLTHLIRADGQEDLTFALYALSRGANRSTALLHRVILPQKGDRQVHGNASFNPQYYERVCALAAKENYGIAFLHSHPGPGWQGMSPDDIAAELKLAPSAQVLTDRPLVGLTCGIDGTWSARFWEHDGKKFRRHWAESVRVVGDALTPYFNDSLLSPPELRPLFRRTVTVWGADNHRNLVRLRIGIVGLGSVGSLVAENLARMGFTRFVLIDFDEIQEHNLDRQLGAVESDIGDLKINVAERQIRRSATAWQVTVDCIPCSVAEAAGYRAALDCDVIFSCVDRPRARSILNHLAYAHLIPVVDGGIQVRFKQEKFSGADWQLQTVAPGRPCLECLGAFTASDVDVDRAGKLDDPSYLAGLPKDHRYKVNENVFPFSANLASLEVFQLIALVTGIARIHDFGVQRFRYVPGYLDGETKSCSPHCLNSGLVGQGDTHFTLVGRDLTAEAARQRQAARVPALKQSRWWQFWHRFRKPATSAL